MSTVRDDFLRRYATSPIHVPRLERMLAAYGVRVGEETFARSFIEWDDRCGDRDAARIATEVLSTLLDSHGRLVCLTSDGVQGAIGWLAGVPVRERPNRMAMLQAILSEALA